MALPVIPDVFRVTLNLATHAGCTPVNVMHVYSDTLNVTEVGDLLAASAVDDMLWPVSSLFEPTHWTVQPLDGVTASQQFIRTDTNQMCGGDPGNDSIMEGAAVLSFRSSQLGPRGRNRLFIGPIAESAQAEGVLDDDVPTTLVARWSAFQALLLAGDAALRVASYVHADSHPITTLLCNSHMGTQRRRLLQTR